MRWRKPAIVSVPVGRPAALRPVGRGALPDVDAVVARERPSEPMVCLRPVAITEAAHRFVAPSPATCSMP